MAPQVGARSRVGRMVVMGISMYSRVAGELVRAREALFAGGESADERLLSRVGAYVSCLSRGSDRGS